MRRIKFLGLAGVVLLATLGVLAATASAERTDVGRMREDGEERRKEVHRQIHHQDV